MLRRVVLAVAFFLFVSPAFAENVLVIVDLQMQTMHVRVDGVTKYRWDVSSGRSGYATPPGRYQPTRMYKRYHSRKYDNAPMPFSIFFHEGYAIHGTGDLRNLGRVASHGCVRLHPDNAETLFALVKEVGPENTVIRIESSRTTTAILSEPPPLPEPDAAIEAAEIEPEPELDELTTGSTGAAVVIPWLRAGLNT
jgi:hypothetical protein